MHRLNIVYLFEIAAILFGYSSASPIPVHVETKTTDELAPADTTTLASIPLSATKSSSIDETLPQEEVLFIKPSYKSFDVSPDQESVVDNEVDVETPSDFAPVAIIYPLEVVKHGDMIVSESNVVFRPLFSYRRQSSQRRRVYYSQPSTSYRTSRGSYPDFYKNAKYDYVS